MDMQELMASLERILNAAKSAVLATVDAEGRPQMRWMTPTVLHGREGVLYAVTSPRFAKVAQLGASPQVQWMVQTPSLDEVVTLTGRINIVDNPSLKAEITEVIGRRLSVFWRVNTEPTEFVVLETVIEEATLFFPMTGKRETLTVA